MNKKTLIFALFALIFCMPAFCQTVKPVTDHDRMYRIVTESNSVEVPAFAIAALKNLAKTKGYSEPAVMRNTILLKPLYNKNLSKDDRLFAAQILMRMCDNPSTTIPVELLTDAVKEVSKN